MKTRGPLVTAVLSTLVLFGSAAAEQAQTADPSDEEPCIFAFCIDDIGRPKSIDCRCRCLATE